MFAFIKKLFSRQAKPDVPVKRENTTSPITVTFDEKGLVIRSHGDVSGELAWQDIHLIAISIEDEWLPFPYWYVGNEQNFLRIPNDAEGSSALFFDGFAAHILGYKNDDAYQAIIEAECAIEGTFIVWKAR